MKKEKKKVGRPSVKLSDLPSDWKETILTLSALGKSDVQIKAALTTSGEGKNIKFHPDLWKALQAREEEFSETIKIGKVLCYAWWLNVGQDSLHDKVFQTGCWYANMKNRFGWKDNKDTNIDFSNADDHFKEIANALTLADTDSKSVLSRRASVHN